MMVTVMLVAMSACTLPRFQPALPEQQPTQIQQNKVVMSDAVTLPLRQWLPPKGKPQAVIVALHGFNDYSNAFEYPARYFSQHGVAVLAYDQRGFGDTQHRGIWAGKQNMIRDLSNMVRATKQKYPSAPLYVLGESMGGAVTIAAAIEPSFPHEDVAGIILSAPALWGGNSFNPLHRFVLWAAAHNLPSMTLTGKGVKVRASDNIAMLRALGRDPLVIKETRVDAVYGLVQLMDHAQERIDEINEPTLLLYGVNDQIIPPKAIGAALADVNSENTTLAVYPAGWHMLLRDLQAKRVWNDVLAWIKHPNQPLPSGAQNKVENFWQSYRQGKI